MNLTITPQVRILALGGLLAILALGGATMLLGRSHSATATQGADQTHRQSVAVSTTPAPASAATHAPPKTSTKAKRNNTAQSAHAAAKPTLRTAGAARQRTAKHAVPRRTGNLVYADLPAPLQWQLAQHKIVVVSLYNPNAQVDSIAVAEAHQGAVDAGAGFLLVSVLNDKVAGILTALLPGGGLLPAPGVLVYRAPGTVALRIDGFADRTSVAQAAQNAFNGETTPPPVSAAAAAPPAVAATIPAATTTP